MTRTAPAFCRVRLDAPLGRWIGASRRTLRDGNSNGRFALLDKPAVAPRVQDTEPNYRVVGWRRRALLSGGGGGGASVPAGPRAARTAGPFTSGIALVVRGAGPIRLGSPGAVSAVGVLLGVFGCAELVRCVRNANRSLTSSCDRAFSSPSGIADFLLGC